MLTLNGAPYTIIGVLPEAVSPIIYLAVSAVLLLVAECASWLPARRATRIDPVVALRTE